ncbi:MAG: hypothetical protein K5871_11495 [Lachnospiraceae bacterium]|nr:hypothetical protein [Lachnospiraceae bacterium]
MDRQISYGQYRFIDNLLFGIILVVSEAVIISASGKWFPGQLYTVSASAAVVAIVMMRWGTWSAVHAALAGIVYVGIQGGTSEQLVIYIIGNEFALIAMLLIKTLGKDRIRGNVLLVIGYALTVQLLMQTGRGIVAVIMGAGIGAILNFITMDALSELFTILIVFTASRLDGIFEDQRSYLLGLQKQNQNGENENG